MGRLIRGVSRNEEVKVCDIEAAHWWRMYRHTHNGTQLIAWPDGGCYLDQLGVVVSVFELIEDEIEKYKQEKSRGTKRH